MTKSLLTAVVLAALIVGLVGCGNGGNTDATATPSAGESSKPHVMPGGSAPVAPAPASK